MQRTLIKDLRAAVGREVTVQGWVKAIRDQKRVQFLILRDPTGLAQATVERSREKAVLNDRIAVLTRESAVTVSGTVVANPIVKTGGIEISIRELTVDGPADRLLPIDVSGVQEPNPEIRLNWRFLDLRRPENFLIFQVQTAIEHAMRDRSEEHTSELQSPLN